MSRPRFFLIITLLGGLFIGGTHWRPTQAVCTAMPGTSIICDSANDSVAIGSTTLSERVDGGGGNDTILIDSLSQVGESWTNLLDGVAGGLGADSIINNGTVNGYFGIRDGHSMSVLPDTSPDIIINNGLVDSHLGINGGDGDTLVNNGLIQGRYGILCDRATAAGCQITNTGAIDVWDTGIIGSPLADTVTNDGYTYTIWMNDGNDIIVNSSTGWISNYLGGAGGDDSLVNQGTIAAYVNLDDGNDIAINDGEIDALHAGYGDDTLIINSGYVRELQGWPGNDSIWISPSAQVGSDSLSEYHGVAGSEDQDIIVNNGLVMGFVGMHNNFVIPQNPYAPTPDDAPDSLTNNGTIISDLAGMRGGMGDTLVNNGSINANIVGIECSVYDLSSRCVVINHGTITTNYAWSDGVRIYSFTTLNNTVINTGLISGAVDLYPGDDTAIGHDSVFNSGTIDGQYVRLGGGQNTLVNAGTSLHSAVINAGVYGGLGDDSIVNGPFAYVAGIDGGDGHDRILNSSTVAGAIIGGTGNDTITVLPGGRANYIGGNDGANSLSNQGFVNTTLQGGIHNDTVTNFAGATASWLDGFAGDDRVLNGGFLNADLIGGDGNDSVVNLAGAYAAFAHGNAGNDTVINGGWLNGSAYGGADSDTVVNLGGANATNLYGDAGNDSVFNGGYLIGTLFGGIGNDTLVNAAFAFAQAADLGDGDDQFTNGGWLNSTLQCGAGNDTVSVGGYIQGGIACGDGNDLVYILNGVVAGQGAAVIGTINGGNGSDGLGFAFTVNVPSLAAANAISAAIAAASPAGGTITIGSMTYTWANFEALYNLLSFNILEDVIITIPVTRRVNQHDAAAPVAIYCAAGGVELWAVSRDGAGSFAASIPYADVNAGTSLTVSGVTFTSSVGGTFTVTATSHDGKPYTFTGTCS
jgi:hypothetical protein